MIELSCYPHLCLSELITLILICLMVLNSYCFLWQPRWFNGGINGCKIEMHYICCDYTHTHTHRHTHRKLNIPLKYMYYTPDGCKIPRFVWHWIGPPVSCHQGLAGPRWQQMPLRPLSVSAGLCAPETSPARADATFKVTMVPGDGVGPELMTAVKDVFKVSFSPKFKFGIIT